VTIAVWAGVGLLGGLGAMVRFALDGAVQARVVGEFPLGTLSVNLSGAFCLGVLTGASVTGPWLLIAGTGFLGSYTTFSTWMLETERLGEEGSERTAVANLAISIVAGLLAAVAGWLVGAAL
jgi:fluoride exporter